MAVHKGFDGYVMVGSQVVGNINHWTITETTDVQDVSGFNPGATGLGRRARKFAAGAYSWTASFDGFADVTDAGQQALKTAIETGDPVSLYFHLEGDKYYAGQGIITSTTDDDTWEGITTKTWDVQGTGALEKYGFS